MTSSEKQKNETTMTPTEKETPVRNPRVSLPNRKWTVIAGVWLLAVISAAVVMVVRSNTSAPVAPTAAEFASAGTPLRNKLYVDPNSQASAWVRSHPGTAAANLIKKHIADQPTGKWFGAWSGDIKSAVSTYVSAAAQHQRTPILVAYNLPFRDCGGQSAGGLSSAQQYRQWIDGFAKGINGRSAIVILEPDSLAMLDGCLSPSQQQDRLHMLSYAVDRLESKNTAVYLDAGHANWVPAPEMAKRLKAANIAKARGFSLNVSNFDPTNVESNYGQQINNALGMSKQVVIDTSRNGNGSVNGEWCNPEGRKIGQAPRMAAPNELLLWVKAPGESDGQCGAAASIPAGQFSPQLAHQLIAGS